MNRTQRSKHGGFTLIELAVVLVIIGLILGAILKGQDLITNARAKKFANWVKGWQTLQLTHLDRKGRYAGDQVEVLTDGSGAHRGDGTIGNNSETVTYTAEFTSTKGFMDVPSTNIVLGNHNFYMYMGNDSPSGGTIRGNVIVVTMVGNAGTPTAIGQDTIPYFEMFDAMIDGTAEAGGGRVRAISASGTPVTFTSGGIVHATTATDGVNEVSAATADWVGSHVGMVYYFDRDPGSL
jgi:prepilin-type N-terminal cleavage/methylation domain-containing protein